MKRLFVLCILALHCLHAYALPLPSRTQVALSGVIKSKMNSRGFAANDPRYGATIASAGSQLVGAAAAAGVVILAGTTAPAWVTAAVSIGIGTAVSIAVDGLINWVFGSDGQVTAPGQPNPDNVAGGYAPKLLWCLNNTCAGTVAAACTNRVGGSGSGTVQSGPYTWKDTYSMVSDQCHLIRVYSYSSGLTETVDLGSAGTPYQTSGCVGTGINPSGGLCGPSNFPSIGGGTYASVGDAVKSLSPADLEKPASPALVADLANSAWQKAAAEPGYSGLPYDATDPITQADVQQWKQVNPDSYPTVSDVVMPQLAPSGGTASDPFTLSPTAPSATPEDDVAPVTPTNPSTEPVANLGPDPGIGAPPLEATPTASQIVSPLFNLMPSLRSFVVPQHVAECPKPSMVLFSKTITLDEHCNVLESVRAILFAVMAFVWAAVAVFIVLDA